MAIRKARRSDLRSIAVTLAAAFFHEELFGDLMHPHRHEYPGDFIAFFERRIWAHWFEPQRTILVSEDPLSGKVIGVADWERQGHRAQSVTILQRLNTGSLLNATAFYSNKVTTWIWPNRAADPSKATVLEDSAPLFSHHWTGVRQESWYLDMLAVHPDYQGKQYGRALVQWGLDEAGKDGVSASVISADGKEQFYSKFGFIEVGRANVGPLAENGIKGGAIMFADVVKSV